MMEEVEKSGGRRQGCQPEPARTGGGINNY